MKEELVNTLNTEPIIWLRDQNRITALPNQEGDWLLIWLKKLFNEDNLYSIALESVEHPGSYTEWYVRLEEGKFSWISCAYYESITTVVIQHRLRKALEEVKGGE